MQPKTPIDRIQGEDLAILVLGPSKSGKSTFINWALGQEFSGRLGDACPAVGTGLASQTRHVQEVALDSSVTKVNRRIILVDTPGLDHTRLSDREVLEEVIRWLEQARVGSHRTRVAAVIYLQDISSDWLSMAIRSDIEILKSLCGDYAISQGLVTIATTKWDRFSSEESERKEKEMMAELWWTGLVETGCVPIERIADSACARALLENVLSRVRDGMEPPILRIEHELIELGLPWDATKAGLCLAGTPPVPRHIWEPWMARLPFERLKGWLQKHFATASPSPNRI